MKKQFLTLTLIGALALILTTSCGGGSSTPAKPEPADIHYTAKDLVLKDLSADGIPATILAPKNATVIWTDDKREAYVYGGKFFKVTIYVRDTTTSAEEANEEYRAIVTNKEVNPDFVKFVEESGTGYLREDKGNQLSFLIFVNRKAGGHYNLHDGITYDFSPDHSTDYTPDDIKVEYAAAKSFTFK